VIPLRYYAMEYIRRGNVHCITRVTGPTHNFLGIEFGPPDEQCVVECLGSPNQAATITEPQLKESVLSAVAKANAEFGTDLSVRRIQYVGRDTPNASIYQMLAKELAKRANC
jgi:hypothetical protein